MTDVLLLSSGGLDSTTLAYWLRQRDHTIVPLFFDYGQHCVEKEWATLKQVLPREGTAPPIRVNISDIFEGSRSRLIEEPNLWTEHVESEEMYIPYRTLLFFAAAAAKAQTLGLSEVYSGFINSNHAKELDCAADFLNQLDALANNVGPVRYQMPFRYKTKAEIAEIGIQLSVPIGKTFSCQIYSDVPCGVCPNCVERISALKVSGLAA